MLDPVITLDDLRVESEADAVLQTVRRYVVEGWPYQVEDVALQGFFRVKDELAIWNDFCVARGQRAIVPMTLRRRALDMAHDGHLGMVRMKQRCRRTIWWPGIDQDIEQMVRECEACLMSGKSRKPNKTPLQPIPWPPQPWDTIEIDIVGELHGAPHDCRFLIVVHDLCSKWPEVQPTSQATSNRVIAFMRDLFSRWGLPSTVITDNGPQFISHEFGLFLDSLGIKHLKTAYYHPQTNGGVERFNQVLKQGLRSHLIEGQSFSDAIRSILVSYRATPHALTRVSPAKLMTNRTMRLPLEMLQPPQQVGVEQTEDKSMEEIERRTADEQSKVKQRVDLERHAIWWRVTL